MLVGSPIVLAELGEAVLEDAGYDSHGGLYRRNAVGCIENWAIVLLGLLEYVVMNCPDGGKALEIALGQSSASSAPRQESGAVGLFVQRCQDQGNLIDGALEIGKGHDSRVHMHTFDDDAHVFDHGPFDHRPDANAHTGRLLFEGRDEALGVIGLLRSTQPGFRGGLVVWRRDLEAGAVQGWQDGWSEDHSHDLSNRVGGIDAIDPQQWTQLESQGRLAGATGATDVDHQRPRQPVDSPNGSISKGRLLALETLQEVSDPSRHLAALQQRNVLAHELRFEL